MDDRDWASGELTGIAFPTGVEALSAGGAAFLTRAFHAAGSLSPDNSVTAIKRVERFDAGGQGPKMVLDVSYARRDPGLTSELFIKFQLPPDHPFRPLFVDLMEPEVRFAMLSRRDDFPICVPACYFADHDPDSRAAILITERISYGRRGIEPPVEKAMDYRLDDALDHYRAVVKALAALAGCFRAGSLGDEFEVQFPFNAAAQGAVRLIPFSREVLLTTIGEMRSFMAAAPQLFPSQLLDPDFLDEFAQDAVRVLEAEGTIHAWLAAQRDLIALCHFNMNLDNGWYWRNAAGELQCGLLDWGGVGQMNLAHAYFGAISAADEDLLAGHDAELRALFLNEYHSQGGPRGDPDIFEKSIRLATAVKGVAWMIDGPNRVARDVPDFAQLSGPTDPRLENHFLSRVRLQYLTSFLCEWRRTGMGKVIRTFDGSA